MNRIRSWLYIGKYRETQDALLLKLHQIEAMLLLAEFVEHPGIVSLYLSVEDGKPLTEKMLRQGISFIKESKAAERRILVACGAGISRSTVFALAALKEIEEIDLLTAYQIVKEHHPSAMPNPVLWKSLCNYYGETIALSELFRR